MKSKLTERQIMYSMHQGEDHSIAKGDSEAHPAVVGIVLQNRQILHTAQIWKKAVLTHSARYGLGYADSQRAILQKCLPAKILRSNHITGSHTKS